MSRLSEVDADPEWVLIQVSTNDWPKKPQPTGLWIVVHDRNAGQGTAAYDRYLLVDADLKRYASFDPRQPNRSFEEFTNYRGSRGVDVRVQWLIAVWWKEIIDAYVAARTVVPV